jgi:hypothetical protein
MKKPKNPCTGLFYKDIQVGMTIQTYDGVGVVTRKDKSENPAIALYDTLVVKYPRGTYKDGKYVITGYQEIEYLPEEDGFLLGFNHIKS